MSDVGPADRALGNQLRVEDDDGARGAVGNSVAERVVNNEPEIELENPERSETPAPSLEMLVAVQEVLRKRKAIEGARVSPRRIMLKSILDSHSKRFDELMNFSLHAAARRAAEAKKGSAALKRSQRVVHAAYAELREATHFNNQMRKAKRTLKTNMNAFDALTNEFVANSGCRAPIVIGWKSRGLEVSPFAVGVVLAGILVFCYLMLFARAYQVSVRCKSDPMNQAL